jgi:tRNA (adenine22-N1)-methyltransferase
MLSLRLQTIADIIQDCDVLLDVGSDHGLLPYHLLHQKRIKRALITDIHQGPLLRAQNQFKDSAYAACVEFILCDGLSAVTSPFDVVVIAGMGHHTIVNIIKQDLSKLNNEHVQIIIQSNTRVSLLRQQLNELGFEIVDERLVLERNHFYVLIKYAFSKTPKQLDDTDVLIGPILRHSLSATFEAYLDVLIHKEALKLRGQHLTSSRNYEILMTQKRKKISP